MLPDTRHRRQLATINLLSTKGRTRIKRNDKGNGKGVIKAKAAQIDTDVESDASESNDSDAEKSANENALWRDGYYCYAIHHAEQTEHFFGVCFNCRDEGHHWRNCDQPLRPALQEIKDKIGIDSDRLNVFGDDGGKGAAVPKKDQKGQKGKPVAQPPKPKK